MPAAILNVSRQKSESRPRRTNHPGTPGVGAEQFDIYRSKGVLLNQKFRTGAFPAEIGVTEPAGIDKYDAPELIQDKKLLFGLIGFRVRFCRIVVNDLDVLFHFFL